jgi:uncharacterized membrane protein YphA (DoxX/SURF4 family)
MLSVFPEFLNYSLLGIFMIRVTIGIAIFTLSIFIYKNRDKFIKKLKSNKYLFPIFYINILLITGMIAGLFMTLGITTQVSALVTAYILMNLLFIDSDGKILNQSKLFYIVLIVICISFIFLGPGFFGMDLPL